MTSHTIALLGNPNCGKTTLFNALTGANQRVGNWPGVTVDRKEGSYRYGERPLLWWICQVFTPLMLKTKAVLMRRLPATIYCLGAAQVVVNIVDASNLERNLYLTTQILEIGLPLVVALNMIDVAQEHGTRVNPRLLSERLGCPVIPMVASRGQGIEELKSCLNEFWWLLIAPRPRSFIPH
jgi:ferrous iron transport protein B